MIVITKGQAEAKLTNNLVVISCSSPALRVLLARYQSHGLNVLSGGEKTEGEFVSNYTEQVHVTFTHENFLHFQVDLQQRGYAVERAQ